MTYCKNCGAELPEGAEYCPKCGATVDAPIQTAAEPRLAYWGERFVAWLIDIILLSIIVWLIRVFVWAAWPGYTWTPALPGWFPFSDFGTSNLTYFLYWMVTEGIYGQSIGKSIMRIKVVKLNGEHINMGQAALESVGKAFILLIDLIVGWILYLSERQRLFSHLAGTIVVRSTISRQQNTAANRPSETN
jgi:uncharacterized RDD family membrane protein YckC